MKKQTEGFLRDSTKAALNKTVITTVYNAELRQLRDSHSVLYAEIDQLKKQINEQVCVLLDSRDAQMQFNLDQAAFNSSSMDLMKAFSNKIKWIIASQVVALAVLIASIIL